MRAYLVAVRGFNFKLMTYQKVISAPLKAALEEASRFKISPLLKGLEAKLNFQIGGKGADMTF